MIYPLDRVEEAMDSMNFKRTLDPILGVVLIAAAYSGFGWAGVALMAGGILMWVLLHFNRMMQRIVASKSVNFDSNQIRLDRMLIND